ncbi:TlpA family protein disulfide reductase, partial [candidate division KSB1 bacterium]|nr:TlpA family protein disulfide reductase [candidate division KSB1 bacterium]
YDDMTQLLPFLPEINPYRKIKMGNPLPEFSLRLIDSKNLITNSDLKGKIVLIDLWSTTCHGCVYEMPLLHKIYEKYQNNNFTILSIACGDTKKSVTEFRNKKWKMPWLNSWDENGWMSEPAKIFEMNIQPKHILIDTNGIIVAEGSKMFGENLEKIIDSYFESILDQSK